MSKLKLIIAPDTRLNQVSLKVKSCDKVIKSTLDDMLECMYQSNGIGLAAPQVGILQRLIVVDCSEDRNKTKPLKLINPEITNFSKELAEFEEGCLSLPNHFAKIRRPKEISVRYINDKGNFKEKLFYGLQATCIQHEIDHLNGILFVDHISKLRKSIIINKLIKYKKKNNL